MKSERKNVKKGSFFIPCKEGSIIQSYTYHRDIPKDLQKAIDVLMKYPIGHVYRGFAEEIVEGETTALFHKVKKVEGGFRIEISQDCTLEYIIA